MAQLNRPLGAPRDQVAQRVAKDAPAKEGNPGEGLRPATEFDHFLLAQNAVYAQVLRELAAGQKQSHWMWFIFPQLKGLGFSAAAHQFALDSVAAAGRYLDHPVLGSRLRECAQLVLNVRHRTAEEIFGYPDWMKFRSSMTLFALCSPPETLFQSALDAYFAGVRDSMTLKLSGLEGGVGG